MMAAEPPPNVMAGKIKCEKPSSPDTGSKPSAIEKKRTSKGPNAKFGSDTPNKLTKPIAPQQSGYIGPALLQDRPVQSQVVAQPFNLRHGCAFSQHLGHGIAGHHVDQPEHKTYNDPKDG